MSSTLSRMKTFLWACLLECYLDSCMLTPLMIIMCLVRDLLYKCLVLLVYICVQNKWKALCTMRWVLVKLFMKFFHTLSGQPCTCNINFSLAISKRINQATPCEMECRHVVMYVIIAFLRLTRKCRLSIASQFTEPEVQPVGEGTV